jgi:hypothetical protein
VTAAPAVVWAGQVLPVVTIFFSRDQYDSRHSGFLLGATSILAAFALLLFDSVTQRKPYAACGRVSNIRKNVFSINFPQIDVD